MTDLTIGGETFRVAVDGEPDRPCVLLANSLGADLTMWDAQMPALLRHFRVVRYDPRGHGQSGLGPAPVSLERLGRDALAVLDALAIETTHFVGLSMGGAVGQWLLVNAPERIERAVLANTSARFGTPELWNARIEAAYEGGMDALAAATMERWFGAAFRAALPERVEPVEAVFRATAPEGYAACCAALRDMDLRESLRAIDRPVLIVTGIDDPVASAADVALLTGTIPGARHVALDCKHISNIEAREAFDAAVIAFLTAPAETRPARRRGVPRAARPATRRRPAAKAARARAVPSKRPAAKAAPKKAAPRTAPAAKAPAKKTPAKKAAVKKAAPTRRATAKTARQPVRKPTTKIPKAVAKKTVTKKPAKKMPAPRRNPAKKPRRPSGRRKP